MTFDLLLQSIAEKVNLTKAEEERLVLACKLRRLKKKTFLYQEGEVQDYVVFVNGGCLRSYSIDDNGVEHILQFAPSGWWIADMQSLLNATPASFNIDAIEDSELILLKQSEINELYRTIPQLERYFRILAERALATAQQRLADALSLTAAERYSNFCQRYPSLIQTLPQKYVASYIGITPEFLSKMLNQPMKKS